MRHTFTSTVLAVALFFLFIATAQASDDVDSYRQKMQQILKEQEKLDQTQINQDHKPKFVINNLHLDDDDECPHGACFFPHNTDLPEQATDVHHVYHTYTTNPEDVASELDEAAEQDENGPTIDILGVHDTHFYYRIPRAEQHRSTSFLTRLGERLPHVKFGKHQFVGEVFLSNHTRSGRRRRYFRPAEKSLHYMNQNGLKFPPVLSGVPPGYTSPEKITSFMQQLAERFPDVVSLVDLATTFGEGPTKEGRPIWAIHLKTPIQRSNKYPKPSILFASCHHARELITPEIALNLAKQFVIALKKPRKNMSLYKLLSNYDIWIVPVVNPDGHAYVWSTDHMHRTNMRGVDLNRNYDIGWDSQGGSTDPKSETYRGEKAFSERETQAIRGLSNAMKFAKVMDFHSAGREVLIHYTRLPMPDVMKNFISREGEQLASRAGYGVRTPTDDAEHQEWQIKTSTSYSFLVETGTSFQPEFNQVKKEISRVWPLVMEFLKRDIPLRGLVRDAVTLRPLSGVRIQVKQVEWQAGEERYTHPEHGTYHLWLGQGVYDVEFSKDGYASQVVQVEIKDGEGTVNKDIKLKPNDTASM